jgi:hypothetical protein
MTVIGGSIESVSIRGRLFAVAADADAKKKLGGFTVEVSANGDGTARKIMTRVPWSIDGITLNMDDSLGDQEFIQGIADLKEYVDITMTLCSGVVLQALGTVTGDIEGSTMASTLAVNLGGPGKVTSQ